MLAQPKRVRRAAAYAGLVASLTLLTLALSQCTMVSDNITGVSLDRSQRANCIQNCKDDRVACLAQAEHECGGKDNACYEAAVAICQQEFLTCKNNCHKQGRGNAG